MLILHVSNTWRGALDDPARCLAMIGLRAELQYLTVIVQTRSIRSLRDLTTAHIPLLTKIRDTTQQVVKDRFDVDKGKLRLFVHYQPSYCESSILTLCTPFRDISLHTLRLLEFTRIVSLYSSQYESPNRDRG